MRDAVLREVAVKQRGSMSAEEYERASEGWGTCFDRVRERLAGGWGAGRDCR